MATPKNTRGGNATREVIVIVIAGPTHSHSLFMH